MSFLDNLSTVLNERVLTLESKSTKRYMEIFNVFKTIDSESKEKLKNDIVGGNLEPWSQLEKLFIVKGKYREDIAIDEKEKFEEIGVDVGELDEKDAEKIAKAMYQGRIKGEDRYGRIFYKHDFEKQIEWAKAVIEKDDGIVWWLTNVYRQYILREVTKNSAFHSELRDARDKNDKRIRNLPGYEIGDETIDHVEYHNAKTKLEHFMSMAHRIPQIANYNFNKKTYSEVLADFKDFEEEWRGSLDSEEVFVEEEDEVLVDFGDGWKWVNLNRSACDAEGAAMGHCGNTHSNREEEIVLSLRKDVDDERQRPALTFIYDEEYKSLGEMKGRANTKPLPKYHEMIIGLLTHKEDGKWFVERVVGGGYAPQKNFQLSDLSKELEDKLYKVRPDLKPLGVLFKEEGMSENVKNRIKKMWGDEKHIDFTDRVLRYTVWSSLSDFISDLDERDTPNLYKYGGDILGESSEFMDSLLFIDYNLDFFYTDLESYKFYQEFIKKAGKKIISDIEKIAEEDDYHYDSVKEFIQNAEEAEDYRNVLNRAYSDGMIHGTYNDMEKDYINKLKYGINVGFKPYGEEGIEDLEVYPLEDEKWYGAYCIHITPDQIEEIANMSRTYGDSEIQDVWHFFANSDMTCDDDLEIPYYGWEDFDDEAATERVIDELDYLELTEESFANLVSRYL